MTPTRLDLASPAFRAGAHAFYARMRDEQPVLPIDIPSVGPAWLVTRYDDVEAVLRDGETFSSRANAEVSRFFGRSILEMDGREHDRTRPTDPRQACGFDRHGFRFVIVSAIRQVVVVRFRRAPGEQCNGVARVTHHGPRRLT